MRLYELVYCRTLENVRIGDLEKWKAKLQQTLCYVGHMFCIILRRWSHFLYIQKKEMFSERI